MAGAKSISSFRATRWMPGTVEGAEGKADRQHGYEHHHGYDTNLSQGGTKDLLSVY